MKSKSKIFTVCTALGFATIMFVGGSGFSFSEAFAAAARPPLHDHTSPGSTKTQVVGDGNCTGTKPDDDNVCCETTTCVGTQRGHKSFVNPPVGTKGNPAYGWRTKSSCS